MSIPKAYAKKSACLKWVKRNACKRKKKKKSVLICPAMLATTTMGDEPTKKSTKHPSPDLSHVSAQLILAWLVSDKHGDAFQNPFKIEIIHLQN